MLLLKGWRYAAVVSGLTGLIFAAIYPTIIDPYFHPEKWQKIQKIGREGINREDIQPGEVLPGLARGRKFQFNFKTLHKKILLSQQ